jgi:hypothetical protein
MQGTDKALEMLKRKYANEPVIMQKLNSYKSHIERKQP